jgi:hypothetical protein
MEKTDKNLISDKNQPELIPKRVKHFLVINDKSLIGLLSALSAVFTILGLNIFSLFEILLSPERMPRFASLIVVISINAAIFLWLYILINWIYRKYITNQEIVTKIAYFTSILPFIFVIYSVILKLVLIVSIQLMA